VNLNPLILILTVGSLAACASPTPPSISSQDVESRFAEFERVNMLPRTSIDNLPTGTASFVGSAGGRASGDADGAVIGDMVMNVNFDGNTIDGLINNLNLLDENDVPEQLLGGDLTLSGSEADGVLRAIASGQLTAVGEERIRGSANVTLNLNGNVVTDTTEGDSVTGTVSGRAGGNFDITISDENFYGKSN